MQCADKMTYSDVSAAATENSGVRRTVEGTRTDVVLHGLALFVWGTRDSRFFFEYWYVAHFDDICTSVTRRNFLHNSGAHLVRCSFVESGSI